MPFLSKYLIQIIIVTIVVSFLGGWLWVYGNNKWKQGYAKCNAEYAEANVAHNEKVTKELPKVEKKYAKKIKSVQGSEIPVGPATAAALDSLRANYEADHR